MASAPLIDLDTLDLSKTVVSGAEIRELCPQRGRFEMLDGLLHYSDDDDTVVGFKDCTADDWWAADHIPGRPLFPGVLQCEAAAQLCNYHYLRHTERRNVFIGFAGMNQARFRGVIEPPARLLIVAQVGRMRKTMFRYSTQGFVDSKMVFETEILGAVV